jgi:hypothetical protein
LAFDHVKDDLFAVADGSQKLLWVVFYNGGLVHKYVLVRIVAMNKTVTITHIEPLYLASNRLGQDFAIDGLNFVGIVFDVEIFNVGQRRIASFLLVLGHDVFWLLNSVAYGVIRC